jgi:hypothetical protein
LKRIVLTGAAVAALFTAAIPAAASAAGSAHQPKKPSSKTVTSHVSCKLSLTTVAAPGSSGVEAGSTSGVNFGDSACKSTRPGVSRQIFSIDDAGVMSGKFQQWFATGSLYGTYKLTEGSINEPPTSTTFGKAEYSGTVTVTGASGGLKGVSGSGTMACYTPDALHFTCIEKLTLSQTVIVPAKK